VVPENWQQAEYGPPEGDQDRGRWQVHLAIDADEKAAIARAAPGVIPAENFEIRTELVEGAEEGESLVAVRVFAETSEEAVAKAGYVLSKIRQHAGLPRGRRAVLGFISPWWHRNSRAAHIAKEAHDLHAQGRHELAVVRIQTAIELRIASTFDRLIRDRSTEAAASKLIRRPPTLRDDQSRELLYLLTGMRVQEATWWPQYIDHLKRRHEVVHAGLELDRDEAFASLEVAVELQSWLLDLIDEDGINLGDGDGSGEDAGTVG
jgi:hypothetical protein